MVHLKNVFNISGWVQNEDDQRQVKSVKLVQFVVVGLTLVLITFYWTYALIVYFDVRPWQFERVESNRAHCKASFGENLYDFVKDIATIE